MSTLPCIVCGKVPASAWPAEVEHRVGGEWSQPWGATLFKTSGHYGSTVFDVMNDTFLEVSICDEHLVAAAKIGHVLLGVPRYVAQPDPQRKRWIPPEEIVGPPA